MKSTGLACVALMLASCASQPYYSNNGYGGGGYPNNGGGQIDATKTAALVAAGIAGLSLYHYGKEKNKRLRSEISTTQQTCGQMLRLFDIEMHTTHGSGLV